MKHAVHQHFVIGCVLAVVGGVVVWTMFVCNTFACIPEPNSRPGAETDSGRGTKVTELASHSSFVISASPLKPISPGDQIPLDLSLENANKTSMSITDVKVIVREIHAPNSTARLPCLLEDFTVEQVPDDFDLTLPAEATSSLSGLSLPRTQWPTVGLRNTSGNQDGCKGASLTLDLTASGKVDE